MNFEKLAQAKTFLETNGGVDLFKKSTKHSEWPTLGDFLEACTWMGLQFKLPKYLPQFEIKDLNENKTP